MATFQGAVDTAANWASVNRVPLLDEYCFEQDTGSFKIGNGTSNYNTLPYVGGNLTSTSTTTIAQRVPITGDGVDGDGWVYIPSSVSGRIALYLRASGTWTQIGKVNVTGADDEMVSDTGGDLLDTGVSTWPKWTSNGNTVSLPSGTVRFSYFTAQRSFTATQVVVFSGGTAAATCTYAAIGIYTVDAATGNLTRVQQTTSDTTLFAGADATAYTKALASSAAITYGVRYAVGVLVVAGTAPTTHGQASSIFDPTTPPFIGASLAGQATLPASVTFASLVGSSSTMYVKILP